MITTLKSYFKHEDERGSLTGIINQGSWQEANFITSIKGTTRGEHFHRKTTELFYIISGVIEISLQDINTPKKKGSFTAKEGDIFKIHPMTLHTFNILEDSSWINFLDIRIDQENPDIHRLKTLDKI